MRNDKIKTIVIDEEQNNDEELFISKTVCLEFSIHFLFRYD